MKRRDLILKVTFVALLIAPIIGWILPANFFDEGGAILCPSRLFFDIECFGCGITRAVMHFHHLQFGEAIFYNTLVIGVYPAMVIIWGKWSWDLYKKITTSPTKEIA